MYHIVCLLVFVTGTLAQISSNGQCNYAEIGGFVTNINVSSIVGTWKQVARIDNPQEVGECSSLTLKEEHDGAGDLTGIHVSYVDWFNKTKSIHEGTMAFIPGLDGLIFLNLTGLYVGQFVVQATDYSNYAILYSCVTSILVDGPNTTYTKNMLAWQYHRKGEPSSSEMATVLEAANKNPDINGTAWRYVSHNKTACGSANMSCAVPHVLILLITLFIGKEFV